MNPALAIALRTPEPGRLLRWGWWLPGVESTSQQVLDASRHWQLEARIALGADRPLLVALGDSLAQGVGAYHPTMGHVGRLQAALSTEGAPQPVLNLSRSGARIADVIDTQLPALATVDQEAALVVCTVGSNDLVRSFRLRRTRRELRRLLTALPPGAVMATVPDRGSLIAARFNRSLRAAVADHPVELADVAARLTTWRDRRAADRFHPNDLGYRLWVEAFEPFLPAVGDDDPAGAVSVNGQDAR
ncbi:MAG: SGNH/GDSL hydrolase family protein [Actinomycetota bacterium]